jgi:transposase
MEARRKVSREFKLEAVKLVKERGVSVSQACRALDVHESRLRAWLREFAAPSRRFPAMT